MYLVSTPTEEQYQAAENNGRPAEMEVWNITRGGYYYEEKFYYTSGRYLNVVKNSSSINSVGQSVKIHEGAKNES